jgi:glutathione peroxidase
MKKADKTKKPLPPVPPRINAFDFFFPAADGGILPLEAFRGQPLLVVNIASACGFTSQLKDLQTLWERYRDRGLVVIGVPSNDFRQEPLSSVQAAEFCQRNYGVDFLVTALCSVIGPKKHGFYRWAGSWAGFIGTPKWNFHKYLVTPEGFMSDWFLPTTSALSESVTSAIEDLLP